MVAAEVLPVDTDYRLFVEFLTAQDIVKFGDLVVDGRLFTILNKLRFMMKRIQGASHSVVVEELLDVGEQCILSDGNVGNLLRIGVPFRH